MVRILVPAAALAAAASLLAATVADAGQKRPLRVTFVGDSVPASLEYVGSARSVLRRGMSVTLDLAVCRRLVAASCAFRGTAPTTAVQAVRSYGRALGDVVIVDVGYNEDGRGYDAGIDTLMRAALAQGAKRVVWATLREAEGVYHPANVAIAKAAGRWPQLVVADWNSYSSGKPWFREDGLHLSPAGAAGLAGFLRGYVLEASRAIAR
jgi:hypothetical protein